MSATLKELSEEYKTVLEKCYQQIQVDDLQSALNSALAFEKKTRVLIDPILNKNILLTILDICKNDIDLLCDHAITLGKKANLIKDPYKAFLQGIISLSLNIADEAKKIKINDTICKITEGKIYLEQERVDSVKILSQIKESNGEIHEANLLLQDLQIESFGSIEKYTRMQIILEQLRLSLKLKDFDMGQIISRKIDPKDIALSNFTELTIKYLLLKIELFQHVEKFLDCSKCHKELLELQNSKQDKIFHLENMILFAMLAPISMEQTELLSHIDNNYTSYKNCWSKCLVSEYRTSELICWSDILSKFQQFINEKFLTLLHHRIIERNLKIISNSYKQISILRFSQLNQISIEKVNDIIFLATSSEIVNCLIDQLNDRILFPLNISSKNNEYEMDILLQNVVKTSHSINKEYLLNKCL